MGTWVLINGIWYNAYFHGLDFLASPQKCYHLRLLHAHSGTMLVTVKLILADIMVFVLGFRPAPSRQLLQQAQR